MGDPRHINGPRLVVNLVDNAVITHSNPPFVITALELLAAGRPGRRGITRATVLAGSPRRSLSALAANATRYLLTRELAAPDEARLHLFEWNPLFMPP